jgi:hypothetical protein
MGTASMASVYGNKRQGWIRKKWKCGHFFGEKYRLFNNINTEMSICQDKYSAFMK